MTDEGITTAEGDGIPDWPHAEPEMRVAPVDPDGLPDATAELLQSLKFDPDGPVPNIFATLAHHPRLLKRWSAFGGTLLFRSELSSRDRELLILRTAWHCRAHYEWANHVPMALRAGVTEFEIARIAGDGDSDSDGTGATSSDGDDGWSDGDAALVRAADELHADAVIGADTWAALADRYTTAQLVEIPMVVGQYHLVAFTLNSLGVQLDGRDVGTSPHER